MITIFLLLQPKLTTCLFKKGVGVEVPIFNMIINIIIIPRLRSRPKFASDQTFQTEIISDQNFQTEIHPDQTFQTQVTSDQTFQAQKVSDQTFQTEGVLIRPSSDHGPDSNSDHWPDLNQTMIRLKCARRGYDQNQLRSKQL